jgi:hypothetical protein
MRRSLGYRGPWRTLRVGAALGAYRLRYGWNAPRPHAFDLEYGTDTASLAGASTLKGDAVNGNGHEPIDTVDFRRLMGDLPAIDLRGFTFVDFGAGQGRAVLLAAEYPLARIVGVEHGLELVRSAEANVARFLSRSGRRQRCRELTIEWADAAAWELPEGPALFYFCEPFRAPMLQRMIGRIAASAAAAPRPVYVLYVGAQGALWDAHPAFHLLRARYESRVYAAGTAAS